jgi:hypothetical protein
MEPTLNATLLSDLTTFVGANLTWIALGIAVLMTIAAFAGGNEVGKRRVSRLSNRQFRRLKAK